jgi:hypothetical protein
MTSIRRTAGPATDLICWRLRQQRRCPLVRAALRTGDPDVLAAILHWHPVTMCPAARLEKAA